MSLGPFWTSGKTHQANIWCKKNHFCKVSFKLPFTSVPFVTGSSFGSALGPPLQTQVPITIPATAGTEPERDPGLGARERAGSTKVVIGDGL